MLDAPERRDTPFAPARFARLAEYDPDETDGETLTWYVRGQNFLVAYTEGDAGTVLARDDQPDEYVLLLPDAGGVARVGAAEQTAEVAGGSLAVVPPGPSEVRLDGRLPVVRLFTTRSRDLADRCSNAADYAEAHPDVAPFQPWPDPPDGYRIRCYGLDVPPEPGRFGRIWRCTTFMVSVLDPVRGPRDPANLSPHSHADFEHCSLALRGEFVHHVRWPWTANREQWREDEHERCRTPSVAIIPPPAIHATEAVGPSVNLLVDIFCPPRTDVSQQAGWVVNADEYPAPPGV
jgi:hypothetical protein